MVREDSLNKSEVYYPLKVLVCNSCWLVQIDEVEKIEEIFSDDYTYFSSFSSTWLAHSKKYVEDMIARFGYDANSLVVEVASNDGYLLQYFMERGVPVLGVEPTANTAKVAQEKGIETIVEFFGSKLADARLKGRADLLLGNNVLAHVPDINDFVKGVKIALSPEGVNTFEFPHLYELMVNNQFDTVYHEHFSYLSLTAVNRIFSHHGLKIFDVQRIPTHGGSLRVFSRHLEDESKPISDAVIELLNLEESAGMTSPAYYQEFQQRAENIKYDFLRFLLEQKTIGKKVVGYGAAAKGNTLLNYAGVQGTDLIAFVSDASTYKQGRFLPGSRIPVKAPDAIRESKPDYVVIFPWNLKPEIMSSLDYIRDWGGKFVTFIPQLEIT